MLDDVRHVLLLEDAAVGGTAQKPQPRAQRGAVDGEAVGQLVLAEAGDIAVEIAPLTIQQLDADGDVLAQQLVRVNGGVFAEHFQFVLEQRA